MPDKRQYAYISPCRNSLPSRTDCFCLVLVLDLHPWSTCMSFGCCGAVYLTCANSKPYKPMPINQLTNGIFKTSQRVELQLPVFSPVRRRSNHAGYISQRSDAGGHEQFFSGKSTRLPDLSKRGYACLWCSRQHTSRRTPSGWPCLTIHS